MQAWDSGLKRSTLAFYLRDEISPTDTIIIGLGFRTERASFEGWKTAVLGYFIGTAFSPMEKKHHEHAFESSLTWLLHKDAKVYAKYATLYRFPFAEEQVSFYGWADGFNLTLDPETGRRSAHCCTW